MLSFSLKHNPRAIAEAVHCLQTGGVVAYPTETAYGLGADALCASAVERIFQIKKRSLNKPLPLIVSSIAMVQKFFRFDSVSLRIAKQYWPGPLTILLFPLPKHQNSKWFSLASAGTGKVGVRVSSHPVSRKLSRMISGPIVSTSANISGGGECYSAREVEMQFQKKRYQPDILLDAGRILKRKPSTIIDVEGRRVVVVREGGVKNFKIQMTNQIQMTKIQK